MQDKQNKVLGLFFNKPKHWHFNELLEDAQISRPQLAQWLKVFEKENLILGDIQRHIRHHILL